MIQLVSLDLTKSKEYESNSNFVHCMLGEGGGLEIVQDGYGEEEYGQNK